MAIDYSDPQWTAFQARFGGLLEGLRSDQIENAFRMYRSVVASGVGGAGVDVENYLKGLPKVGAEGSVERLLNINQPPAPVEQPVVQPPPPAPVVQPPPAPVVQPPPAPVVQPPPAPVVPGTVTGAPGSVVDTTSLLTEGVMDRALEAKRTLRMDRGSTTGEVMTAARGRLGQPNPFDLDYMQSRFDIEAIPLQTANRQLAESTTASAIAAGQFAGGRHGVALGENLRTGTQQYNDLWARIKTYAAGQGEAVEQGRQGQLESASRLLVDEEETGRTQDLAEVSAELKTQLDTLKLQHDQAMSRVDIYGYDPQGDKTIESLESQIQKVTDALRMSVATGQVRLGEDVDAAYLGLNVGASRADIVRRLEETLNRAPTEQEIKTIFEGRVLTNPIVQTLGSRETELTEAQVTGDFRGSETAALTIARMPIDYQQKAAEGWDYVGEDGVSHHVYGSQEWDRIGRSDIINGFEWVDPTTGLQAKVYGSRDIDLEDWERAERSRRGYNEVVTDAAGNPMMNPSNGQPLVRFVMGSEGLRRYEIDLQATLEREGMTLQEAQLTAQLAAQERQLTGFYAEIETPTGPRQIWVEGTSGLEVSRQNLQVTLTQMGIDADVAKQNADQEYQDKIREGYYTINPLTGTPMRVYGTQAWEEHLSVREDELVRDGWTAEQARDRARHEMEEDRRLGYDREITVTGPGGRTWTTRVHVEGTQEFTQDMQDQADALVRQGWTQDRALVSLQLNHDSRMQVRRDQMIREGWTHERAMAQLEFEQSQKSKLGYWQEGPDGEPVWVVGDRDWEQQVLDSAEEHEIDVVNLRASIERRASYTAYLRQMFINQTVHDWDVEDAEALRAWQEIEAGRDRQLQEDLQEGRIGADAAARLWQSLQNRADRNHERSLALLTAREAEDLQEGRLTHDSMERILDRTSAETIAQLGLDAASDRAEEERDFQVEAAVLTTIAGLVGRGIAAVWPDDMDDVYNVRWWQDQGMTRDEAVTKVGELSGIRDSGATPAGGDSAAAAPATSLFPPALLARFGNWLTFGATGTGLTGLVVGSAAVGVAAAVLYKVGKSVYDWWMHDKQVDRNRTERFDAWGDTLNVTDQRRVVEIFEEDRTSWRNRDRVTPMLEAAIQLEGSDTADTVGDTPLAYARRHRNNAEGDDRDRWNVVVDLLQMEPSNPTADVAEGVRGLIDKGAFNRESVGQWTVADRDAAISLWELLPRVARTAPDDSPVPVFGEAPERPALSAIITDLANYSAQANIMSTVELDAAKADLLRGPLIHPATEMVLDEENLMEQVWEQMGGSEEIVGTRGKHLRLHAYLTGQMQDLNDDPTTIAGYDPNRQVA